jgi:hypothetical protein
LSLLQESTPQRLPYLPAMMELQAAQALRVVAVGRDPEEEPPVPSDSYIQRDTAAARQQALSQGELTHVARHLFTKRRNVVRVCAHALDVSPNR